mmetsp:Transcript_67240/g.216968  ORF Transcript_67240/g.216968 Transcript_67240/m.216968 type:complete len:267 (+) Transcript_67240:1005-1805(+)
MSLLRPLSGGVSPDAELRVGASRDHLLANDVDAPHLARVLLEGSATIRSSDLPKLQQAVHAARHHLHAIREEADTKNRTRMPLEGANGCVVLEVPEPHGTISGRRGQHLVNGGEGDAPDTPSVPLALPEQLALREAPDADELVVAARGNELVVGRDGHVVDLLGVRHDRNLGLLHEELRASGRCALCELRRARELPDLHRLVLASAHEPRGPGREALRTPPPPLREGQRGHRAGVPRQAADALCLGGAPDANCLVLAAGRDPPAVR